MSSHEQIEELKKYKEMISYMRNNHQEKHQENTKELNKDKVKVKRLVGNFRGKNLYY